MQYLYVFLFLLAACAKSPEASLPEPVSGDLLASQALPGVVRVLGQFACTGTFISQKAVLTAAHCLEGGGPYRIRSQAVELTSDRAFTMVQKGNYNKNDLGIITFNTPVISPELVLPMGKEPSVGETMILIGYGCSDVHSRVGGGVKRMGTNVLSDISDYLEVTTPFTTRGIIGPKNRAGSCYGDSGSPLLKKDGDTFTVLGVDHGARSDSSEQISLYVNLFREDNRKFIETINRQYELLIPGL